MTRIYIENFCHDLNYSNVILYIGAVRLDILKQKLIDDCLNHMYRFDRIINDKKGQTFMYVENCDLQDLTYDILYYIAEGYTVATLHEDKRGRYYIEVGI